MNNEKLTKAVFRNTQELLSSLNEKDRAELITYFKRNEITENTTLEPIFLFQYNAALFVETALEKLNERYEEQDATIDKQKQVLNEFLATFNSSIETATNIAISRFKEDISTTAEITNNLVSKSNDSAISLADNISAYIDTSVEKMLTTIATEKESTRRELAEYVDLIKNQLDKEIQGMIVKMVQKDLPEELRKSVKTPIAEHLTHYTNAVSKNLNHKISQMEVKTATNELWDIKRVVRDFAVFGGATLFVLTVGKLFGLI